VHPKTQVEYITAITGPVRRESTYGSCEARQIQWLKRDGWCVVAFRVVKEYVEPPKPREWWMNEYPSGIMGDYDNKEDADRYAEPNRIACIHVIEVLK